MASIPCAIHLYPLPSSSSTATAKQQPSSSSWCIILSSLSLRRRLGFRVTSWFWSGKNRVGAKDAGVSGSRTRDDFDHNHVKQDGSYVESEHSTRGYLLIMASSKGDKPKIEELLRAGASYDAKDVEGRTAIDRASKDEIKDFIVRFSL